MMSPLKSHRRCRYPGDHGSNEYPGVSLAYRMEIFCKKKMRSSLSRASNLPQPLPLYYSTAAIFMSSTGRNPMYLSVH
jgi:hypothetical protein